MCNEKRQLESLDTLLVALGLLAPIAWQLLLMRHLTRERPETPATLVLSVRQIALLRRTPAGTTLSTTASIREVLVAVARLGGHLRQNGEPGWLVLNRGMQKLLTMEVGWVAASTCDQCHTSSVGMRSTAPITEEGTVRQSAASLGMDANIPEGERPERRRHGHRRGTARGTRFHCRRSGSRSSGAVDRRRARGRLSDPR